jgi:DNA-directed RNA polymerase subunit RPC12/RpoP
MPAVTKCPNCEARLDLKTSDKYGKRVRCPRCREPFTAKPAGKAQKAPSPRRERDEYAPQPRLPAKKGKSRTATARQKTNSNSNLKPFLIGGASLLAVLLVGVIIMSLFGTKGGSAVSTTSGDRSNPGLAETPARAKIPSAPVSESDAQVFVTELERAAASGDSRTFNRLINYRAIIDRAITDVDVPQTIKNQFRLGALNGGTQMTTQILKAIKAGGTYKVVNYRNENGQRQVLFRMNGETGLNYHLFDLIKVDGETRAGDMFVALTGEYVSSSLRRLFVPLAQQANRSLLDRLMGKDKILVEHWATIEKLQRAFLSGQYQAGMVHFNKLPPELQQEKFVLILRFNAASANPLGREYSEAISAFRAAHPNSVAANFMAIDYFLLKKEYAKSLAAIAILDDFTHSDPYLNIMRGNIQTLSGDASGAQRSLKPMLDDPDFGKEATTAYLDVAMALGDHQETLDTLLALETKHGLQFPRSLRGAEGFEAFASSPQHKDFQNR